MYIAELHGSISYHSELASNMTVLWGPLIGGPQCGMSILRNGNVAYFPQCHMSN